MSKQLVKAMDEQAGRWRIDVADLPSCDQPRLCQRWMILRQGWRDRSRDGNENGPRNAQATPVRAKRLTVLCSHQSTQLVVKPKNQV